MPPVSESEQLPTISLFLFFVFGFGGFKNKRKRRSVIKSRLEIYMDAHLVGELMCDVQAKAGAACFAGAVILGAIKLFKDVSLVALADANAGVFNAKVDAIFRFVSQNSYRTAFGVLDCVGDKVLQDFFQIKAACLDGWQAWL